MLMANTKNLLFAISNLQRSMVKAMSKVIVLVVRDINIIKKTLA